eukprot:366453-Chlamydomonas_euryale.AAC.4
MEGVDGGIPVTRECGRWHAADCMQNLHLDAPRLPNPRLDQLCVLQDLICILARLRFGGHLVANLAGEGWKEGRWCGGVKGRGKGEGG